MNICLAPYTCSHWHYYLPVTDNPSDAFASDFLNILSSANIVQLINFRTQIKKHILNLIRLLPLLFYLLTCLILFLTSLIITEPLPIWKSSPIHCSLSFSQSFCCIGSINRQAGHFMKDIIKFQMVLNPPSSTDDVLLGKYSTLFQSSFKLMYRSLPNTSHTEITLGSLITFKHSNPFAGPLNILSLC